MIKIACIGLLAVFLAMTLKSVQSEYAVIAGVGACMHGIVWVITCKIRSDYGEP